MRSFAGRRVKVQPAVCLLRAMSHTAYAHVFALIYAAEAATIIADLKRDTARFVDEPERNG